MAPIEEFGKKHGYSNFEIFLSVYIILCLLVAIILLGFNQVTISRAFSPHYAQKSSANSSANEENSSYDPAPTSYSIQTYSAHDFKISADFDPHSYALLDYSPAQTNASGASIPNTENDGIDIIGNPLDIKNEIDISVTKDGSNGAGLISTVNDPNQGYVAAFKATIMGQSYAIYTVQSSVPVVLVNLQVAKSWYFIKITNYNKGDTDVSRSISRTTETTILQSLKID
jgi:hypothetical protein